MSDNSSSTGSSRSGSLTTSWTMLSPEEAPEIVDPVDDGTGSLCDVPSLSEEVAGATVETKPSDPETPIETVLSEEGQQVCQEMAPDTCEGPAPSRPTLLSQSPTSGVPLDHDLESQPEPPIIHSMVTSSPTDNEQLAAMPFVTHVDLVVPLDVSFTEPPPSEVEPELCSVPESSPLDTHTDTSPVPERIAPSAEHDISIHTETPTPTGPPSDTDIGPAPESPAPDSPPPDTIGSEDAAQEPSLETGETELPEKVTDIPKEKESPSSFDFGRADTSTEEGNGLRRRNVAPTMTSDDDDEEVEFKLAERKGGKKGFSMNTCIVASLVLLCLGSLFLSDDSDELSVAEQNQDWLNDPQKMKALLDKLTQENHQISQLETQLQAHKEELDSALNAGSATGNKNRKGDLEQENTLKEELSSLPGLKEELELLRARVTELSQLTAANQDTAPPPSSPTPPPTGQPGISNQSSTTVVPERRSDLREGARVKEELQRQKVLLEESRKRLEGRKKDEGYQKRVRESLAEIQRRLSEQVEKMGRRSEGKKKPWESRNKDGKKDKDNSKGHWKNEEKKGEKYCKHGMEGRWKEKDERKERDWKANKENSHKEACKKSQDEWEKEKNERRLDRDKRKQERPWQSRKDYKKKSNHHHQDSNYQEQHQPHQYEHTSFWKHQEEKLGRNVRPLAGCSSVEDCASQEGLFPVELSEFEELLDGYLSKLERATSDSKAEIQKLAAMFFRDGVFVHDKVLFSDFAEDVADILEDMVDILEVGGQDDDALEEAMEEFEREALWKFAATT
ncbi:pre-B-cell leukemia transcription factor-interacting protein 1 [Salvelinus fontinalis]|uniref:pre-B-cell leukemia transcription factor-interacting protein 1 n=1 Tax=Salvelinus fontinalis TaxID=8038 RepID=UPI002484E83B|nr:pre-B-cell leukemia transcription factor-interacting protein 1 [Salvelinus fontinalis]XP_055731837.1 pre-B-cell leukemia transcription factor-interacting protein 1 [Salvelinus fontinalis]